jgi:hypothetical protein
MLGESPWNYAIINATGVTVVSSVPVEYGGLRVIAAAGAFTIDVYDNASAASGQRLDSQSVAAALDKLTPSNGIRARNGLVANMSGDPTDALILVFWR